MDVRLPDGTIVRGVPDGMTRDELAAKLTANGYKLDAPAKQEDSSTLGAVAGGARDLAAGAVRGAGSIGASIVDAVRSSLAAPTLDAVPQNMRPAITAGLAQAPKGAELRSQMDAGLHDLTGADTDSIAYGTGKVGAEVAGTLGAGGGVANVLTKAVPQLAKIAPGLVEAIRSGGMTTGVRAAPGVVPQAINLGTRAAGGAINGGLSSALVNPDEAGAGAAVGGAIPVVGKAAGAAGRVVGGALSQNIARSKAVDRIAASLGPDAQQVIADLQTYFPKGAESIPVSAAAITKNPALAQLEQGSRLRSTPPWYDFDVKQGKAAYDNVIAATADADQLGARAADRAANWEQAWQKASEAQKPRVWQTRMNGFFDNVDRALQAPQSSNPAVKGVLDSIKSEMDRLGPNFSIGNLQQLRANLNGKVQPMSQDAFKSAPRDNPAIISIKQEMDDILNGVTGGKWQKVIEGYAADSEALHASKAAQKVRNAYVDADTGRVVSPVINGDIPRVTAANLTNAVNAARLPDKSLAMSAAGNQRLEATIEALRRQGMVQEVKRTASAGGGSDSVSNALTSGVASASGAPNMLLQILGAVRHMGMGKQDNALAQLLSRPDDLRKALDALSAPVSQNRLAATLYRSAPAIAADQ